MHTTVSSTAYRVTPTIADAYDQCPRFAVLAPPFVSTPETEHGQRLHHALYLSIARMLTNRPTSDTEAIGIAGIAAGSLEADEAEAMLVWVRAYLQEAALVPFSAEAALKTRPRPVLGAEELRVELVGRVDLVARTGRTLHLLDLKTGKHALSEGQLAARPSSAIYTLLGRCTWPDVDRIVMTHLYCATRTIVSTELTAPQIEAGRATVRYIVGLLAENSAPQIVIPGEHCGWCPVRQNCPAWPAPALDSAETALF